MQAVSKPCESGRCCKIAAPAPSPKSTHVVRSFQSMMDESFSAPITSTHSLVRDMMNCCPTSSA